MSPDVILMSVSGIFFFFFFSPKITGQDDARRMIERIREESRARARVSSSGVSADRRPIASAALNLE